VQYDSTLHFQLVLPHLSVTSSAVSNVGRGEGGRYEYISTGLPAQEGTRVYMGIVEKLYKKTCVCVCTWLRYCLLLRLSGVCWLIYN
jgi:hypothetical protein